MANLLDRASVVLTPTAYNNGEALCIKPDDASGDFQFSRNSAATRVNAQGLVENVQILSSNLVQNGDFSEEGVQEVSNGSFSQEGSELITNGDFSNGSTGWNKSTQVTIENGVANIISNDGSFQYVVQNNVTTIGKSYVLTYTIISNNNGDLRFGNFGGINSTIGTHSFYFVADQTSCVIARNSGVTDISIDNVSVREVAQDWDLGTGWSIGEDKAISDGTSGNLYQSGIIVTGKQYKIQATVSDYVSGNVEVSAGAVPRGTMSANGTYTFYQTASSTSNFFIISNSFNGSVTNISVKEVGQNWTLGTGWSIGNDKVIATSVSNQFVTQPFAFTSGKRYRASFSITGTSSLPSSTSLRLPYDGNVLNITYVAKNSDGVYSHEFISNGSSTLYFGYGSFTGTITNISVIEITDDTNLPRINYEGFSYQDALGSEEITGGDFSNPSDWGLAGGSPPTITNNKLNLIGDTYNSIASNIGASLVSGKTYKVSFEITDYTSGGATFRLGGVFGVSKSGLGVHTQYIVSDGASIRLYSSQNGTNLSLTNVSVKEYLGQEVVPNSGCGSWLWEPQSTNVVPYSSDFSQWTLYQIDTPIANQGISPNGNNEATKITTSTSKVKSVVYQSSTISGNITRSVFAKKGSADFMFFDVPSSDAGAWFNLSNGQLGTINSGTATIEDYGNGWYRCSCTANWTSYTFAIGLSDADNSTAITGGKDILIWGAQTEALSYATSYIPTSGSTVTRNQDVCNNGGSLATINSTEGVLYAEMIGLGTTGSTQTIGMFSDNVTSRVLFRRSPSANRIQALVYVNSIIQFNVSSPSIQNGFNKVALKYKENDFALWINGTEIATGNSGLTPSIPLSKVSFKDEAVDNPFFGKTKAVAVWKEALSDQELADLTYPTPTDPTFTLDFDTIAEQFTFARGSEATYVDAQGLIQSTNELGEELILNGGFDTDSDWNKASGVTISDGKANAAFGSSGNILRQSLVTFDANKTYKYEFTISNYVSGNLKFASFIGAVNESGNGTYVGYGKPNGTGVNNMILFGSFEGSIDNVSVKEYTTATNTPRLDYSTGAEAFLLEPQSTNLITQSELLNLSLNNKVDTTITDNYGVSPSGQSNSSRIQFADATSFCYGIISISTTHTASVYVKGTSGETIRFGIGANVTTGDLFTFNGLWQRIEYTTASATQIFLSSYGGATATDFEAFGLQLEELSYATSYIPSNGSQTTRNQETCINATPEINSEQGVLYAEISALEFHGYISISDGTYGNSIRIGFVSDTLIKVWVYVGNSQVISQLFTYDTSNMNKIAVKYSLTDFKVYINGSNVFSTSSVTFPIGTLSKLAFRRGDQYSPFFGNTKDIQVYTKALSDAELINLTTI